MNLDCCDARVDIKGIGVKIACTAKEVNFHVDNLPKAAKSKIPFN